MLKSKPVTAIVPVRGGSKGIPRKNLRRIGRHTLLERAIKLGLNSAWVDRVIVSTDDPQMYEIATALGVAAPTLRPKELASDAATTAQVVEHLVSQCNITEGYLLLLQATAPLRTVADLDRLCRQFETSNAESIVSVARHDEPRPEKLKRVENGVLLPYMGEGFEGPRQALPQPYALNGAFYLISVEAFLRERRFLPKGALAFEMPPERSHNLDNLLDWQILEAMVNQGYWTLEEYD